MSVEDSSPLLWCGRRATAGASITGWVNRGMRCRCCAGGMGGGGSDGNDYATACHHASGGGSGGSHHATLLARIDACRTGACPQGCAGPPVSGVFERLRSLPRGRAAAGEGGYLMGAARDAPDPIAHWIALLDAVEHL